MKFALLAGSRKSASHSAKRTKGVFPPLSPTTVAEGGFGFGPDYIRRMPAIEVIPGFTTDVIRRGSADALKLARALSMDADVELNSEVAESALTGGGAIRDATPAQAFESASAAPWASFREQAFSTRTVPPKPPWEADPVVSGAGLAVVGIVAIALVAIGGLAAYEFLYQSVELSAKTRQVDEIASRMTVLEDRVDSIQATQRHEQAAAGDGKANEPQTRDVGNVIAELNGRVSRIDEGVAAHFADIALRLDKLEEKAATPIALAQPPAAPKPSPTPASTKPPSITEITAPIENPTHVLRGFAFTHLRDGVASIKGPDGAISVSAGDAIPGAGQVLRIEKRGPGWVVVTSLGIIKMAVKASVRTHKQGHGPTPAAPTAAVAAPVLAPD